MATGERRSHERALVDHDHAALIRHGVRDYSRERCWNDYRRNAIHGLQIGVFGPGGGQALATRRPHVAELDCPHRRPGPGSR
jgi:hypothetical protein